MPRGFFSFARRGQALYILLGVMVICLICLAIIARNWSCRKPRPPRPPRVVVVGPYEVVSVDGPAALTVKARGKRTRQVMLVGVAAPDEAKWVVISKDHLKEMAGGKVTVQYERHGIVRGNELTEESVAEFWAWWELHAEACPICLLPPTYEEPELKFCEEAKKRWDAMEMAVARGCLIGLVFGESGINLNIAQVQGGYAKCAVDASEELLAAERDAEQAKRGLWAGK